MKPEDISFIQYRLERANESLQEAGLLLNNEHLHTSVNRVYYACFYAVTALLYTEGLAPKTHSGTQTLFEQEWVKTEREWFSIVPMLRRGLSKESIS